MKLIVLCITSLLLINNSSCENRKNQEISSVNNNVVDSLESKYLDVLLSCGEFAYFESDRLPTKSYYRIPYYGCPYYENDSFNNLGWADIILIPKRNYEKDFSNINDYAKIDSSTTTVSKMPPDELQKKFRPVIFLIEKKYLQYMKNAEINYYPKLPYIKKLFIYKSDLKGWILSDSIEIHNELDDGKWVNMKLEKMLKEE